VPTATQTAKVELSAFVPFRIFGWIASENTLLGVRSRDEVVRVDLER
jgi:hypothetical protein